VRQTYAERIVFSVTGIANARLRTQLTAFSLQLRDTFGDQAANDRYSTWLEALAALGRLLDKQLTLHPDRRVVFFDELPWLASPKSGFLAAFSWFWNSWAMDRNLVVVICGSAASWMIRKVVRDKGSLHNRITHRITLKPFTLPECNAFFDSRGVVADPYQRLQLYMAFGGVPFYLEQLNPGQSATQNIQRLLFGEDAVFREEFDLLYQSLFTQADRHIAVVRALAAKPGGLTRKALEQITAISSGGRLTRVLDELELSGFIDRSYPFGAKKKQRLIRLIDEYSAFYIKFVEGTAPTPNRFPQISLSSSYRSWSGFAFERVCLRNVTQIASALSIAGIAYTAGSYVASANEHADGVQIDLLLDRSDRTITLIEAKYSENEFVLTKVYAAELREKIRRFRAHTKTKKHVNLALVTTYGLKPNQHSIGLIENVISLIDLLE